MKMIFIFSYLFTGSWFFQQFPDPVQTFKIRNADGLTVDQFGYIYITQFDQLKKYDPKGKEVFAYSNPLVGSIHSVSALDPMNLLLFYKDQAQITTLDNRLSEQTALKFTEYGLSDVQLISQSDEENIWVYDQATDKLYRLNKNRSSVTNKSLNITQITKEENTPVQLESTYNNVYLNVPEKGILVFDATGSLIRTLPIKQVDHFALSGNELIACISRDIFSIDQKTGKQTLIHKNDKDIISLAVSKDLLYILSGKTLEVYSPAK